MPITPHTPIVVCEHVGRCTICGEPGDLVTIQDGWLGTHLGACASCKTRWIHSVWLVHLREAIYADPLPPDWTTWLNVDGHGRPDLDILGTLGEMAYGKVAGLPEAKDDTHKTHELGSVHVRTVLASDARLIIRPSDPDGSYVLARPFDLRQCDKWGTAYRVDSEDPRGSVRIRARTWLMRPTIEPATSACRLPGRVHVR